jgi:glucosamine kinase
MSTNNSPQYILGIDGGGSKTKTVIVSEGNIVLGTGISGPGNPLHGFEQSINSITESALLALKNAGLEHLKLSDLVAGVGLAGVNLPSLHKKMSEWENPFKKMFLASDLLVACLAAHDGKDGAVMISGTGSCGFSYVKGEEFMMGGHGFPQGDKASGAWFGLQACETVLLALDGVAPPTAMTSILLDVLGVSDEMGIVESTAGKKATHFGKMANLVFDCAEQGDATALKIIEEGIEYIMAMTTRLEQKNPERVAMLGGLTRRIVPFMTAEFRAKLTYPIHQPEIGSVIFARQQLAK